ncbi:hypothetical protein [Dactylosporangium sp. NPDC005555]|uniref:hypothetical protein n=1 Tax=Dactylosporangium sp. NPDC005555 TaxID=3154889 RepID=UPI0033BEC72F
MIDSEAIRAAFGAIADEAQSPERIRAGLATRARHHRQRRLVLRVAGAGVAVGAAGVGVWRLTREPETGFPEVAGGPGGGWLKVPLRYRPAWLPGGYGQYQRSIVVVGDRAPVVSLDWRRGTDASISLMIGWHDSLVRPEGRTETVDVHGVAGRLVQTESSGNAAYVTWQPPGGPQLIVAVLDEDAPGEQRATALRVARSVRPDQRETYVGPRLGWLPDDLAGRPWRLSQGYQGQQWIQEISATGAGERQLHLLMGPDAHKDLADHTTVLPVQLDGLAGWYAPDSRHLFLTLDDGVQVLLGLDAVDGQTEEPGQVPPELTRIIEALDHGPWPDMTWVGSR